MACSRAAWRVEVEGEGPEHAPLPIKDRCGPTGTQTVLERAVTVIVPQRIGRNVLDDNRLAAEGCRAARTGVGADGLAVKTTSETFREARRGAVAHMDAVAFEQQDRTKHARALRLDYAQEKVECF